LMDETGHVPTPLELKLKDLGKILIYVVFMLTALTVAIGIYHGQLMYDMFLAGVSLAVAVIPEGLPAIVTVALSLGVQRMIKRKAIVRKLSAIETLGSTSVICTDKTGTITENKMTVREIFIEHETIVVTGEGDSAIGEYKASKKSMTKSVRALHDMILFGAVCNNAALQVKKGKFIVDGDPTDGALLVAARKLDISHNESQSFKVLHETPFDSTRKRMSVIAENESGERFLIVKGAPEMVLPRSQYKMRLDGSQALLDRQKITDKMDEMATKALRIIAISIKKLSKHENINVKDTAMLEKDLIFIGLYGLQDPPRQHVKRPISNGEGAGIKTVMITGDHKKTAIAIGKQVGLYKPNDLVLEGHQLNDMSIDK